MKLLLLLPVLLMGCVMPGTQRLFPENKNIHADEVTLTTPYGGVVLRNIDSVVSSNFTRWPKPSPFPWNQNTPMVTPLQPSEVEQLRNLLQKIQ